MDVDRISPMGGIGQDGSPAWTREKMRRRKFTEEVEPEVETDAGDAEVAASADSDEDSKDRVLDLMA